MNHATPTNDADELARVRRYFAREVTFLLGNAALTEAFATVPRELFLEDGPWLVQNRHTAPSYVATPDANPRHLYHDHHVAIDATGFINSGGPSFNAFIMDAIGVKHGDFVIYIGSGCGYFAGVLGAIVGNAGRVLAIDCHADRAARAKEALRGWPQVEMLWANGAMEPLGLDTADAILVGAGVTHPTPNMLMALRVGGRMVFPLMGTAGEHYGAASVLLAERLSDNAFAVTRLCDAAYLECVGARDAHLASRIDEALAQDRGETIASLRL